MAACDHPDCEAAAQFKHRSAFGTFLLCKAHLDEIDPPDRPDPEDVQAWAAWRLKYPPCQWAEEVGTSLSDEENTRRNRPSRRQRRRWRQYA